MPSRGIVLVLGAGAARGAALAGVLRRLRALAIPIDTIVGCSVGAIVGSLYAAGGLEPDEMIDGARRLGPASLFHLALSLWRIPWLSRRAAARSGGLMDELRHLDGARFEKLHHGVRRLGILVYDLTRREEILLFGGPGRAVPVPLRAAVEASAAIPILFPPCLVRWGGRRRLLIDAGWHTAVPIERCFGPPISADHVVAVDLSIRLCVRQWSAAYWEHLERACGDRLLVLRPDVARLPTMIVGRGDADRMVAAGEAAVDDRAVALLRSWTRT